MNRIWNFLKRMKRRKNQWRISRVHKKLKQKELKWHLKKNVSQGTFHGWLTLAMDPANNKVHITFSTNVIDMELSILKVFSSILNSKSAIETRRPQYGKFTYRTWEPYQSIKEIVDISIPNTEIWVIGYWNLKEIDEHAIKFALSQESALKTALKTLPRGRIVDNQTENQLEIWSENGDRPYVTITRVEASVIKEASLHQHDTQALKLEKAYLGLRRCEICNQYKGYGIQQMDFTLYAHKISCSCDIPLCTRCGLNKASRPRLTRWDESEHRQYSFRWGSPLCSECEAIAKQKEKERRLRSRKRYVKESRSLARRLGLRFVGVWDLVTERYIVLEDRTGERVIAKKEIVTWKIAGENPKTTEILGGLKQVFLRKKHMPKDHEIIRPREWINKPDPLDL
jgi:hypothetical protein